MNWESFWGTFIAVIPAATIVTLLVNWISRWWTKPRPHFSFEAQLVRGDYSDGLTGGLHRSFVAMTNIGNGPAFHVTIDGHLCDAGVNLPRLSSVTKERIVDEIARIEPGEILTIETAAQSPAPNDAALVVKWRDHPGRRFPPSIPKMRTVRLRTMPTAAFLPVGLLGVKPLPRLFRRFRNLSQHTARGSERQEQLNLPVSKNPARKVSATPSSATASDSQGQPKEQ